MGTHKIHANLDVDGEVQGTSLDINGAADISGNLTGCAYQGDVIASAYLDSDTMHLSVSQNITAHKEFQDSIQLRFGNDQDLKIQHSGTHGYLDCETGNMYIRAETDNSHIYIQADNGSGANATYIDVDGDNELILLSKPLKIGTGATVSTILDEDAMGSNSATALATQQSIKAYVTASVSAAGGGDVTLAGAQTFTGAKTFTGTVALTGTGRITGVDTVSASTDAASKAYVDGAVIANTDTQDLSQSGNTVSLVNGGSVDISTTTAVAANTAKTSNVTHTGEVTGSGSLTIAGNVVDEANLKVSNSPTNGYYLTAQSGNTGGLTWAAIPTLNQNTTGSSASCTGNAATATKISSITNSNIVQLTASQTLTNKTIAASQVTEISNITASEGAQLENIGSTTISATQWGYLGAATGAITNTDTNTQLSTEQVQDIVGGMLVGTETRIGVTYDDTNGRINFVVDDMTANTNTQLSNAEVRAAVAAATDSQVFTDADHTKLNGIATNATADQTNVSGSSGSCTGNAATATALTSGNKSINGNLTVTGSLTLSSDDHVIADGANILDENDDLLFNFSSGQVSTQGVFDITNTTDSTNATGDTGALRTEGGASIAKKLYVGSTITGSADVIAYSDERLKKNVKTLDGKKVLEMRGVSFERVDSGKQSSGVIAQEMEKVAPELVIDDGNYKGVAYGNVVGYLIEAIKDQQKQIDELKTICNGCSK